LATVRSPVWLKQGDEHQVILGSAPLLDADTALTALDAAVQAYDKGRGAWPNMRVAERIQHVETFLAMREQRQAVVKLLMWEIGKNLKDSEKNSTAPATTSSTPSTPSRTWTAAPAASSWNKAPSARSVARLGVALCMGPYNYPLNETFTTLIPALIMGNTVVFKPAKFGVLLIRPCSKRSATASRRGVINVIYGRGRKR
jgi:glyceraldehyde-3-phosphate dehydrogenase (NADP+)